MKKFFRHPTVSLTIKGIISILLLWALSYYIDIESIVESFSNATPFYIIVGLCLALTQLMIHLYRWRYLLRLVSNEITNEEAVNSFFVGFMAGFFTPAQLGEFAGRIASHPNVNRSHIIGITLVDKLYWAALTFIVGGGGLAVYSSMYFTEYWHWVYSLIVIVLLGILTAASLSPEHVKGLFKFLPKKFRDHRAYEMINVIDSVFHNKNGLMLFLLTAVLYGVILFEYYFLAIAFGDVRFLDALICCAAVFFVKAVILPISFGDLGVRESASVFFLERTGTSAAVAFNASLIMSFANVIVPTAIGALLVLRWKRR